MITVGSIEAVSSKSRFMIGRLIVKPFDIIYTHRYPIDHPLYPSGDETLSYVYAWANGPGMEWTTICIASHVEVDIDYMWIPNRQTWRVKKINPKDLILYSHWEHKSPTFFDLLERSCPHVTDTTSPV